MVSELDSGSSDPSSNIGRGTALCSCVQVYKWVPAVEKVHLCVFFVCVFSFLLPLFVCFWSEFAFDRAFKHQW